MRSVRQYVTLCSIRYRYVNVPNVAWPTDRVLVSQISIGRRDRESLQQDRKHCQFASLGSARFSCFPFLLRSSARQAKRVLVSQISIGRWDRKSLQRQETLPIRVLGSARFFCFPFFSKSLSLPRGDTKNATRKATEPPFAFEGPNLVLGLTLRREW